jgi:sugar-specific transcriptional regulator TrmB
MQEIDITLVEKLEKSGLTEKESAIYSALLTSGGAFPSTIASQTKLNRTTVYHTLDTLAVKGLVTELEKKKKLYYQVEHPRNMKRYAETQITRAKRQLEYSETLLPKLEGLFKNAENKPVVHFFEGIEGVLRVYESHVEVKQPYEMLAWSNTENLMEFLSEDFRNKYIKKKERIGITTRAIFPDSDLDKNYNEEIYKGVSKKVWIKFKNISKNLYPYKSDITIFGDNKVSIINFEDNQLSGTIIEDSTIYNMMKMIFELSWQGADVKSKGK